MQSIRPCQAQGSSLGLPTFDGILVSSEIKEAGKTDVGAPTAWSAGVKVPCGYLGAALRVSVQTTRGITAVLNGVMARPATAACPLGAVTSSGSTGVQACLSSSPAPDLEACTPVTPYV